MMHLLPSKFEVNGLKHARVIANGGKRNKNHEENKTNFEDAYLSDGWADLTHIWNRRFPILREFPLQNWLISVQAL